MILSGCAKSDPVAAASVLATEEDIQAEVQDTIPETEELDAEEPDEYKIIMVGDVLLHTPIEENCRQADGSYDYHSLFVYTKDEIA